MKKRNMLEKSKDKFFDSTARFQIIKGASYLLYQKCIEVFHHCREQQKDSILTQKRKSRI